MSIFVLGRSRSGKTPFAAQVALALGWRHLSGSEWVRRRFPAGREDYPDRAAYVEAITRFSLAELRRDPRACVEYLRAAYDLSEPFVAEGLRNPHDFVHLFDPRSDAVVDLEHAGNDLPPTGFEGGLGVIDAYLDYLAAVGMWDAAAKRFEYRFQEFHDRAGLVQPAPAETPTGATGAAGRRGPLDVPSLDAALSDFLGRWKQSAPAAPDASPHATPAAPTPLRVHADIPPLKAHVRGEYLYDMDPGHAGEHVPCTAFAVSSYAGSVPTFNVLLADGSVFSYLPPTALVDIDRRQGGESPPPLLELADLAYHNCPDADLCVHSFDELRGPVQAYFKRGGLWMAGEYLFTVDWYTGNDLLHLVALENGQFAFLPHHKLKFKDGPRDLPAYRKMHGEWKV